jgi:hypothetical protein
MTSRSNQLDDSVMDKTEPSHQPSRRKFLATAGGLSLLSAFVIGSSSSCKKSDSGGGVNLGSGDIGILNYAYALEQLEAAFYTKVVASPYTSMPAAEASYLADIRDHEIAHREFFKAALGSNAIIGLDVNFSSIDFTSRTSVLATAKAFEDLGVTAYNGAGPLITDAGYLALAGKIVSVEARHAALIRDLITPGSFADSTALDANGMDMARTPSQVFAIAGAYINTKLDISNLPS